MLLRQEKKWCGIHTEELFDDYEDGVSLEKIADTVEKRNPQTEKCRIFDKTQNLNNYEKVKNDIFIRL